MFAHSLFYILALISSEQITNQSSCHAFGAAPLSFSISLQNYSTKKEVPLTQITSMKFQTGKLTHYFSRYFKQRKLWSEFLGRKEDDDIEMGGMDSGIRLSTTVSRPSEFITSIHQPQGGENGDATGLPGSLRNTLRGIKSRVETTFQPSYSYKSETWREDITFKNAVSAKTHYRTGGWGETSFAGTNKRKLEDIELPYTFTAADEDVSTDSDPDERDEEVVSAFFYCFTVFLSQCKLLGLRSYAIAISSLGFAGLHKWFDLGMLDFANNLCSRTSSPLESSLAERLGLAKKYVSLSCWIRSVVNKCSVLSLRFPTTFKEVEDLSDQETKYSQEI
jgi:hypothetical protein